MRGERETGPVVAGNYRGNATPGTPSTASTTVRQNPLNYQRMHSNDSDKDGNGNGTNGGSSTVTSGTGGSTSAGVSPGGGGRNSD